MAPDHPDATRPLLASIDAVDEKTFDEPTKTPIVAIVHALGDHDITIDAEGQVLLRPARRPWSLARLLAALSLAIVAAIICVAALHTLPHLRHPAPPRLPLRNETLRILPLGDSITNGFQSSSGDGYRAGLVAALQPANALTLLGTQHSGTLPAPFGAHEGHNGFRIGQIAAAAAPALAQRPDVVLLHAGTNDLMQSHDVAAAPARLDALMGRILVIRPSPVLLVAQLIGSRNATLQADIDAFNAQVAALVAARAAHGAHVAAVDMRRLLDVQRDMADPWHPNDRGYKRMAAAWVTALEQANARGWIGAGAALRDGAGGGSGLA